MKRKHIDAAREIRLWIGQVIVPSVMTGVALLQIPSVKEAVNTKFNQIKTRIVDFKDRRAK